DNSSNETGFQIYYAVRGGNRTFSANVPPIPGDNRVAVRTVSGLTASADYCFSVRAVREISGDAPPFGDGEISYSDVSKEMCTDQHGDAGKPDIYVQRIGQERTYAPNSKVAMVIVLGNNGADAINNVEFTISSSDGVALTEMLVNPNDGWQCEKTTVP